MRLNKSLRFLGSGVMRMPKWLCECELSGSYECEVEADSAEEAEEMAIDNASFFGLPEDISCTCTPLEEVEEDDV